MSAMTDITSTIDTHLAAYCEPDRGKRTELIASAWSEDGAVVDPPIDGRGRTGIADIVDALLAQFPGHHFERTTAVDAHHDHARYGWALVAPDGNVTLAGTDFATVGTDGKLTRVVGFFGEPATKDA